MEHKYKVGDWVRVKGPPDPQALVEAVWRHGPGALPLPGWVPELRVGAVGLEFQVFAVEADVVIAPEVTRRTPGGGAQRGVRYRPEWLEPRPLKPGDRVRVVGPPKPSQEWNQNPERGELAWFGARETLLGTEAHVLGVTATGQTLLVWESHVLTYSNALRAVWAIRPENRTLLKHIVDAVVATTDFDAALSVLEKTDGQAAWGWMKPEWLVYAPEPAPAADPKPSRKLDWDAPVTDRDRFTVSGRGVEQVHRHHWKPLTPSTDGNKVLTWTEAGAEWRDPASPIGDSVQFSSPPRGGKTAAGLAAVQAAGMDVVAIGAEIAQNPSSIYPLMMASMAAGLAPEALAESVSASLAGCPRCGSDGGGDGACDHCELTEAERVRLVQQQQQRVRQAHRTRIGKLWARGDVEPTPEEEAASAKLKERLEARMEARRRLLDTIATEPHVLPPAKPSGTVEQEAVAPVDQPFHIEPYRHKPFELTTRDPEVMRARLEADRRVKRMFLAWPWGQMLHLVTTAAGIECYWRPVIGDGRLL